jgi:hypothetical protein
MSSYKIVTLELGGINRIIKRSMKGLHPQSSLLSALTKINIVPSDIAE